LQGILLLTTVMLHFLYFNKLTAVYIFSIAYQFLPEHRRNTDIAIVFYVLLMDP